MRYLFFISFIFITIINCSDRIENADTKILERFDNGEKKILCQYDSSSNNKKIIKKVTFNKDGLPIKIEHPVAQTVKLMKWRKNGKKKEEQLYKKGKKHGVWYKWFSNGRIKIKRIYNFDKLVYKFEFYKGISNEYFYKKGKLNKTKKFVNGIVRVEKKYHIGKLISTAWYYPDGKISDEREYKEGQLHGECIFWDRNGTKRKELFYRRGKLSVPR